MGIDPLEEIQKKEEHFETNSKNASDAIRVIVGALLFPTLAMAYEDNSFSIGPNSPLIYPLIFFCLYFFFDLFQFLFTVFAIHACIDHKKVVKLIRYIFFYGKFVFGLVGLINLILCIVE